jgi:hypothetical protein
VEERKESKKYILCYLSSVWGANDSFLTFSLLVVSKLQDNAQFFWEAEKCKYSFFDDHHMN